MAETRAARRTDKRLPPKWWGIVGAALGVAAFVVILATGDPKAPFGESLGNALTAFLGCVVAGWGVTQAVIAHEARNAATEQAEAASEQVSVMREQIDLQRAEIEEGKQQAQQARAEAEANRSHADRTLRATIKQRLDAQAPRVTISGNASLPLNVSAFEWRDCGSSYVSEPGRPPTEWQSQVPADPFRLTGSDGPIVEVRVRATIHMRLVGSIPARIDIVDGRPDHRYPHTVILTEESPERTFTWTYVISANALHTEAHNNEWTTNGKHVTPRFWVRDLTMNTLDEFSLSWNFQVIRRDGDFLTLTPESINLGEEYSGQFPRRYEYFDKPVGYEELGLEMNAEQKELWGIKD